MWPRSHFIPLSFHLIPLDRRTRFVEADFVYSSGGSANRDRNLVKILTKNDDLKSVEFKNVFVW